MKKSKLIIIIVITIICCSGILLLDFFFNDNSKNLSHEDSNYCDHEWEYYFIVDKEPTYTEEGEQSYHCYRCGERTNIQSIPKLEMFSYTSVSNEYVNGYEINGFVDTNINVSQLVIPTEHEGLPVIRIANYAFEECSSLTSIEIPNSVISIGYGAFRGCSNLTSIEIPNSVLEIRDSILNNCSSLESLTLPFLGSSSSNNDHCYLNYVFGGSQYSNNTVPESLKHVEITSLYSVPNYAFYECHFIEEIVLPETCHTIGDYAFYTCSSLESIELPEGLSEIGESAFEDCVNLYSINFPGSLQFICEGAFRKSGIKNVTFEENLNNNTEAIYSTAGSWSIDNNNYYYSPLTGHSQSTTMTINVLSDGYLNVAYYTSSETGCDKLIIKKNDVIIDELSGSEYTSSRPKIILLNVSANDQLTFTYLKDGSGIGGSDKACFKFVDVNMNSEMSIYDNVFGECLGLKELIIPNKVVYLGSSILYGCTNLESLTLPFLGSSISDNNYCYLNYVFNDPQYYYGYQRNTVPASLKHVEITSLYSVPDYAFYECEFIEEIVLPETYNTIGDYAFYTCSSLESIELPEGLSEIGEGAFVGCSSLTSIEIPDSVTSIGNSAFSGCSSLESIELPEGLSGIGEGAFAGCSSLENISLPEKLGIIADSVFSNCTNLNEVYIPETVHTISESAFYNCTSLQKVNFGENDYNAPVVEYATSNSWSVDSNGYYYSPSISNSSQTTMTVYIRSTGMIQIAYYTSSESGYDYLIIKKNSSEITRLSGTQYNANSPEYYELSVEEGDTLTFTYSKDGSQSSGLDKAYFKLIPVSANAGMTIKEKAFSGCSSLTQIIIPSYVKVMEDNVFYNCSDYLRIYCEVNTQPSGWESNWHYNGLTFLNYYFYGTNYGQWQYVGGVPTIN